MKIIVEGTTEEIAALVIAIQKHRTDDETVSAVIDKINQKTQETGKTPLLV